MEMYPDVRLRRLRSIPAIRNLVRETRVHPHDFVYPLFVCPGKKKRDPIVSMPGQYRFSPDMVVKECQRVYTAGVQAVLLFGIPITKNPTGSTGSLKSGVVQQAVRAIKKEIPGLAVITDVCLCEYTDHGHCGVIRTSAGKKIVDNDATLSHLNKMALSHVEAGADMVAPSDMMDGRIASIRSALDNKGLNHISIMSYSAKTSSAFYGPFRDAAGSAPKFGDRKTYQMDPANRREAMREIEMDVEEGADILMVKPGLAYLDIVRDARNSFDHPIAVYNVSGEYSMVKAAAAKGWVDEKMIVMETLTSMKRAGADIILTYWAVDAATWINDGT